MNLAFPALLVLLLVLPGLIFRYSYASWSWGESTPTSFRNVTDELAYGVVLAVGLHCIWTRLAQGFGYPIDFGTVLALLLGNFGQGNATYVRDVLDTISLFLAHRRELENDRNPAAARPVGGAIPPDDRYYDILGDRLILLYSQLRTLNLDYIVITPDDSTMQVESRTAG